MLQGFGGGADLGHYRLALPTGNYDNFVDLTELTKDRNGQSGNLGQNVNVIDALYRA